MNEAAAMFVIKDGRILSVSRKYDHTKFGLCGGKREGNESLKETAIRETKEETGINVYEAELVFQREEPAKQPDGLPFYTYCFLATKWDGESRDTEEGIVRWLTCADLTGSSGAFPIYNYNALQALLEIYPDLYII